jgi:hypothetical protein
MSRSRKLKTLLAVSFSALTLNPSSLLACSVCYGDPDSGMSQGLVWGISVLLGVVLVVLGGISTFFVYLAKKSATDKV